MVIMVAFLFWCWLRAADAATRRIMDTIATPMRLGGFCPRLNFPCFGKKAKAGGLLAKAAGAQTDRGRYELKLT
ncbi:MAG: hypothetical protein HY301_11390 [Verrucomicrobia bacterium]|nr:hypothetical protein [Verrucomicrobiota bacterium]